MDTKVIGGELNLTSLRKEIKKITKSLKKQNRMHLSKKMVKITNKSFERKVLKHEVDIVKLNDFNDSSQVKMKHSKLKLRESISSFDLLVPDTTTLIRDRLDSTGNTKEAFINLLRMRRSVCRFCPKQQISKKSCQKHRLSRMKGHAFGCKFCGEHFEFKSFLIDHIRSLHSNLVALEKVSRRAVKGILPNMFKNIFCTENVLSKYSNLR